MWQAAILALALTGCVNAGDALSDQVSRSVEGPGLRLRLEGQWGEGEPAAIARGCEVWSPYLIGGCRIDPTGDVPVYRGADDHRRSGFNAYIQIGASAINAHEVELDVVHSIPGALGFQYDDATCAASSNNADRDRCWARPNAIDLTRCREVGVCSTAL